MISREVRRFFDGLTMVAVVAAIMMLVRPGSNGPGLVKGLGDAFEMAVSGAVGAKLTGKQPLGPAPQRGGSSSGGGGGGGGGLPNPLDPWGIAPWDQNLLSSSRTGPSTAGTV